MENISFQTLKCSTYLKSNIIGEKQAKVLFQFRTRMYQVKGNFKKQYLSNLYCDLCKKELCTQKHLFECKILKNTIPELKNNQTVKYEHIFGNENEMNEAARLLQLIIKEREFLLDMFNSSN